MKLNRLLGLRPRSAGGTHRRARWDLIILLAVGLLPADALWSTMIYGRVQQCPECGHAMRQVEGRLVCPECTRQAGCAVGALPGPGRRGRPAASAASAPWLVPGPPQGGAPRTPRPEAEPPGGSPCGVRRPAPAVTSAPPGQSLAP